MIKIKEKERLLRIIFLAVQAVLFCFMCLARATTYLGYGDVFVTPYITIITVAFAVGAGVFLAMLGLFTRKIDLAMAVHPVLQLIILSLEFTYSGLNSLKILSFLCVAVSLALGVLIFISTRMDKESKITIRNRDFKPLYFVLQIFMVAISWTSTALLAYLDIFNLGPGLSISSSIVIFAIIGAVSEVVNSEPVKIRKIVSIAEAVLSLALILFMKIRGNDSWINYDIWRLVFALVLVAIAFVTEKISDRDLECKENGIFSIDKIGSLQRIFKIAFAVLSVVLLIVITSDGNVYYDNFGVPEIPVYIFVFIQLALSVGGIFTQKLNFTYICMPIFYNTILLSHTEASADSLAWFIVGISLFLGVLICLPMKDARVSFAETKKRGYISGIYLAWQCIFICIPFFDKDYMGSDYTHAFYVVCFVGVAIAVVNLFKKLNVAGIVVPVVQFLVLELWYILDYETSLSSILVLWVAVAIAIGIMDYESKVGVSRGAASVSDEALSLFKLLLLSTVTLGIYNLIWIARTTAIFNEGAEEKRDGTVCALLSLFVPFYNVYWLYKSGLILDKIDAKERSVRISTLCTIAGIASPIVSAVIMQDRINELSKEAEKSGNANLEGAVRGVFEHFLLTVFTLGIYNLVWVYRTTEELNKCSAGETRDSGVCVLLSLFVPFYRAYWAYKTANMIDRISNGGKISLLTVLFAFFAFPFDTLIIQGKINDIVERKGEMSHGKTEL